MMRWTATILLVLTLLGTASAAETFATARLSEHERVVLDRDHEIYLLVRPRPGDAWTRLSLRVTGDASQWKRIAELNGMGPNLLADREVKIPIAMVRTSLRLEMARAIFPEDRPSREGWIHTVIGGGSLEGESLWKIAEWFTGDGANYRGIRNANGRQRLSTRRGEQILIPAEILAQPYHSAVGRAPGSAVRLAEDDPVQTGSEVIHADLREPVTTGVGVLEYDRTGQRPHAVYRLERGEALYSSVVIRFTGRLYARDVNEVVEELVAFNGITDVSRLPVGFPVRIPMEFLLPEHRPPDDPRRIEYERSRRESARLARRVEAKDLEGIHIVLDPGHGGRDVGTSHDSVWESTYVYDVACRLKEILERETGAVVWMTTRSREIGYRVTDRDRLEAKKDHVVLTTPHYAMDDPIIGVNLRWYLANSIYRRARQSAAAPEKVIFLSLHADSLHPSLRGAMAYIPGERYTQGSFEKAGEVYLARSEVRESPEVTMTREEALAAEGLSNELASSIIRAFRRNELRVHPFQPIRGHVVRNGREWVPAVIRYNKIPSRLLLEICNLGNPDDRKLLQTRNYRNQIAQSIYEGIVEFYDRRAMPPDPRMAVAAAGR